MLDAMTNQNTSDAGRPIRLGALAPLSRPGFLEAGRHLRAGIELAVEETNAAGGIDGRPLELALRDTAGSPERAAAAVRDFAAEDAVAVVGEYHSVVAHAAAGAALEARIPFVCSSAVLDAVVDSPTDLVARVAPAQSYCWRVYADYLVSAGYRHVALVVQPDRYWSAGARAAPGLAGRAGGGVTEIDHATMLGTPMVEAMSARARATPSTRSCSWSVTRSRRSRWSRPYGRSPAWRACGSEIRPAARSSPSGRRCSAKTARTSPSCDTCPHSSTPWEPRVTERLTRIIGQSPSFVALEGYDSVRVVAEALRIGGPDRPSVIEALGALRVAGTRGEIGFSRCSGRASSSGPGRPCRSRPGATHDGPARSTPQQVDVLQPAEPARRGQACRLGNG